MTIGWLFSLKLELLLPHKLLDICMKRIPASGKELSFFLAAHGLMVVRQKEVNGTHLVLMQCDPRCLSWHSLRLPGFRFRELIQIFFRSPDEFRFDFKSFKRLFPLLNPYGLWF